MNVKINNTSMTSC